MAGKGKFSYSYDKKRSELIVNEGTKEIPENKFSFFYIYKPLTLPDSLKKIGKMAFAGAKFGNIEFEIDFGNSLKAIDTRAFYNSELSGALVLPDSLTDIAPYAFSGTYLSSVEMGDSLTFISPYAFASSSLKSISFGDSLREIGNESFRDNRLSGRIKLPDGLEIIGREAFSGNYIEKVYIPDSVRVIRDDAFAGNHIDKVVLPARFKNKRENYKGAFDSHVKIKFRKDDGRGSDLYEDTIIGTSGTDVLKAGASPALLNGKGGDDELIGSKKDDLLYGNTGNDRLKGGKGADIFKVSQGADVIVDFNANQGDVIRIEDVNVKAYYDVFSVRRLYASPIKQDVKIQHRTGSTIVRDASEQDVLAAIECIGPMCDIDRFLGGVLLSTETCEGLCSADFI